MSSVCHGLMFHELQHVEPMGLADRDDGRCESPLPTTSTTQITRGVGEGGGACPPRAAILRSSIVLLRWHINKGNNQYSELR